MNFGGTHFILVIANIAINYKYCNILKLIKFSELFHFIAFRMTSGRFRGITVYKGEQVPGQVLNSEI